MYLIKEVGVATVPGSSFYAHRELGRTKIRFCFPKTDDVLLEAGRRLQRLPPAGSPLLDPGRSRPARHLRRAWLISPSSGARRGGLRRRARRWRRRPADSGRPPARRAPAPCRRPHVRPDRVARILVVGAGKASGAMAAAAGRRPAGRASWTASSRSRRLPRLAARRASGCRIRASVPDARGEAASRAFGSG